VRDEIVQIQKEIVQGKRQIFQGPISDNEGKSVAAAGQALTESQILNMNYLVSGVVGKVSP
jgi:simple sugar transport system substrate-binding protein